MKKAGRIAKRLIFVLIGIVIVSTVSEQLLQIYFDSRKPALSEFVEVNGVNIHFVKKGNGGPTVVFQSGLGGDHKIWKDIQDSISPYATTISYDRRGLLWSEDSSQPRTMASISAELTDLLEKTNCPKPYILVGHSLAGITLREFIRNNRSEVAGIVFVDVSHPDQILKTPAALQKYLKVPPKWAVSLAVETGILRMAYAIKPFISDIPASHEMNVHIRDYFYKMFETLLAEASDDDPMFQQAKGIEFGDIPLTIITGAYPNGVDFLENDLSLAKQYLSIHREGQKDLLNLSTKSNQIIAPNSGHYVPLTDARLVTDAILDLLKKTD